LTWPAWHELDALRFVLILARTAAFFSVLPPFGGGSVPMRVKAGAAGAVTLLLFGSVAGPGAAPEHWLALVLMLARETLLGLLLGTLVRFVFMGAQFAGQTIGVQMGLGAASLFDPNTQATVMVNGRFYYLLAVLLFLGLNLHHPFLEGFGRSFRILPLGADGIAPSGFQHWAQLSSKVLLLALRLSLPVIGGLLILDTALGFLARLVPQMNIFLLGFPLKIALGFAILALGVGAAGRLLRETFGQLVVDFHSLMTWMH